MPQNSDFLSFDLTLSRSVLLYARPSRSSDLETKRRQLECDVILNSEFQLPN